MAAKQSVVDGQGLATAKGFMRDIRQHRAKIRTLQAETGRLETALALYAAEHFRDLFADDGDSLDLKDGSVVAHHRVVGGPLILEVCDKDEVDGDEKVEGERFCHSCLCTEGAPCITPDGPCSWVDEYHCSACVVEIKVADGLPEKCMIILPGTGDLGAIRRGESGYHAVETARLVYHDETLEEARDRLNAACGVNRAQVAAMLVGSMCGWHVPGADPAAYNEDGSLKR